MLSKSCGGWNLASYKLHTDFAPWATGVEKMAVEKIGLNPIADEFTSKFCHAYEKPSKGDWARYNRVNCNLAEEWAKAARHRWETLHGKGAK